MMTEKLETVLEKISTIPNPINSWWIIASQIAIKRITLRRLYCSAMNFLLTSPFTMFRKKILEFLNKRVKPKSDDPDEKWITTWNDYLGRLKFFFRAVQVTVV